MSLIPRWGRSPGGEQGNPLQCSCLENPGNRDAWKAMVFRVSKSHTWLSDLAHTHTYTHTHTHHLHGSKFERYKKLSLPSLSPSGTPFPFSEVVYSILCFLKHFKQSCQIYVCSYIWNYIFSLLFNTDGIILYILVCTFLFWVSILLGHNLHTLNFTAILSALFSEFWTNIYSCIKSSQSW